MPKLAIQEDMLPGRTLDERIANAAQMGLDGVEFLARDLDERLPVIATALEENGSRRQRHQHGAQRRLSVRGFRARGAGPLTRCARH